MERNSSAPERDQVVLGEDLYHPVTQYKQTEKRVPL